MTQQTLPNATQTIEITNFGGRLTRVLNGEMNSGFAKFVNSFGYDPFSKPGNLTWLEQAVEIGPLTNLALAAKTTVQSGVSNAQVYVIDKGGKLYTMQQGSTSSANVDSVIGIASVLAGPQTYTFGASMDFYAASASVAGAAEKIYIGGDLGVNSINFDGTADTQVTLPGFIGQNVFRPMKQFIGNLSFSNKYTVASIGPTGTVISPVTSVAGNALYSDLNPPLPTESIVQDIDLTADGNYLLITGANQTGYQLGQTENASFSTAIDSALFKWNGIDKAVTALTSLPGYYVTALQTYLNRNIYFSLDAFGGSLSDDSQKMLTLPKNKPPLPNATCVNGNFLTWACVETVDGTERKLSLYYFGSLDQENPPGLYRLLRFSGGSLGTGYVNQVPLNTIVANSYETVNPSQSSVVSYGYGKHYVSAQAISASATTQVLLRFTVNSTGTGTPQAGRYETQTQLFSKKITIKQIRVYTEPTVTGNAFELRCIKGDGTTLSGGSGAFTYSYAAGTDITLRQGALERIDFNPALDATYALGIRITNTGSTNMTIKKIEVDYQHAGK